MNLIEGQLSENVCAATGIAVAGRSRSHTGNVALGNRPEDCAGGDFGGRLNRRIDGVEPTSDITCLTLRSGDKLLEVNADRIYGTLLSLQEGVALTKHGFTSSTPNTFNAALTADERFGGAYDLRLHFDGILYI